MGHASSRISRTIRLAGWIGRAGGPPSTFHARCPSRSPAPLGRSVLRRKWRSSGRSGMPLALVSAARGRPLWPVPGELARVRGGIPGRRSAERRRAPDAGSHVAVHYQGPEGLLIRGGAVGRRAPGKPADRSLVLDRDVGGACPVRAPRLGDDQRQQRAKDGRRSVLRPGTVLAEVLDVIGQGRLMALPLSERAETQREDAHEHYVRPAKRVPHLDPGCPSARHPPRSAA